MNKSNFDRLVSYTQAVVTAKRMYEKGLLKLNEFSRFERKMMKKYSLSENSIFRIIRLDNTKE